MKSNKDEALMEVDASSSYAAAVMKTKLQSNYKIPKRTFITDPADKSSNSNEGTKNWPPGLRNYVQRAFEKKTKDNEKAVNAKVKRIVATAQQRKQLWDIDWDNVDIPDFETPTSDIPELKLLGTVTESHKYAEGSSHEGVKSKPMIDLERRSHLDNSLKYSEPTDRGREFSGKRRYEEVDLMERRVAPTTIEKSNRGWSVDTAPSPVHSITKTNKKKSKPTKNEKNRKMEMEFSADSAKLESRKSRFDAEKMAMDSKLKKIQVNSSWSSQTSITVDYDSGWNNQPIVGTCGEIYKSYLRLTSAPDPTTVRPLFILKRTFNQLKSDWKRDHNYTFICDQLKSLRQDLTVQRIRNQFTVQVYELHSRIAIEMNDLGEFNQCSAQLQQLYSIFEIPGSEDEFTAYRILYMLHTKNKKDLVHLVGSIKNPGPFVIHALQLRSAVSNGDFVQFFKLFYEAPNMGGYLIDQFIDRERVRIFLKLARAYRPKLTVESLSKMLGFLPPGESLNSEIQKKTFIWIRKLNIPIVEGAVDCKSAVPILLQQFHTIESSGVDIKGQIH